MRAGGATGHPIGKREKHPGPLLPPSQPTRCPNPTPRSHVEPIGIPGIKNGAAHTALPRSQAEGEGFEPSREAFRTPHRLAGGPVRPLRHPSIENQVIRGTSPPAARITPRLPQRPAPGRGIPNQAEGGGFEPPRRRSGPLAVFKTAAFSRSAIPPPAIMPGSASSVKPDDPGGRRGSSGRPPRPGRPRGEAIRPSRSGLSPNPIDPG